MSFGKKTKPNQPCPCCSGLKYKKCCFRLDAISSTAKNNDDKIMSDANDTVSAQEKNNEQGNLRFKVGDRVLANHVQGFQPGKIVALNYREPGWLCSVPYQILLDSKSDNKALDGQLIYAPFDDEYHVLPFPKFGGEENDYYSNDVVNARQCGKRGKRSRGA